MSSDPRLQDSISRLESATVDESPEFSEVISVEAVPRVDRSSSGMTIFIPNWNHEAVLPRALKSAFEAVSTLQSEGFSAEILVIDDASRDGSVKLLRTIQAMYAVTNLRVIRMGKNYDHVRLNNLALEISRFRYVLRLDADNELVPDNVPTLLRSAIETQSALLYGNLVSLTPDKVLNKRALISNMPATLHLTDQNYIDSFTIVDAFEIMDVGGYARVNPYSPQDWEMNLHLIAQEKLIVFVPLIMGYYHTSLLSGSSELSLSDSGVKRLRRIYAQSGTREWDKKQVGRIYHPQTGFLDEWGY